MPRPPIHPYLPLIPPLMESLMGVERARLKKEKSKLVKKNHLLGGSEVGFYYLDMRFADADQRFQEGTPLPYVLGALIEDASDLYAEVRRVEADEQKLRQALSVVVPKCNTLQEVRDVLPEIFIREVPQLRALERQREPGFILEEYPMLKPQFMKALEIADYYTVNKLIF